MRWLEYGQRLRREQRGALRDPGGGVATALLEAATSGGALALGVKAGRLEPGYWADLVAIDLDVPALTAVDPEHLLEGLVFGAGNEVVSATAVAGQWRRTGADTTPDP
jgi:cytosine/adenosine deaminase-related metal-dependent hydrolase